MCDVVRILSAAQAREVGRWATSAPATGLDLIGVPPGPVTSAAPEREGLLSSVRLLDTPRGLLAIKTMPYGVPGGEVDDRTGGAAPAVAPRRTVAPRCTVAPRPWLRPDLLMRREIDVLRGSDAVAGRGLVPVYAIAPDPGMIVMAGIRPVRHLDQLAGVSVPDVAAIAARLGALHARWNADSAPAVPPLFDDPLWRGAFADARALLPRFTGGYRAELGDLDPDLLARLVAAAPVLGDLAREVVRDPRCGPRIVSLDMRADNILWDAGGPCFIDWQFAAVAPGAADLAVLVGTSTDLGRDAALAAIRTYAAATGCPVPDAVTGFLIGLIARAVITIPLAIHLVHPTARSRLLRAAAIRRLARLLAAFSAEVAVLLDGGHLRDRPAAPPT